MVRNMQQLVGTLAKATLVTFILPPLCWFYLPKPNLVSVPLLTDTWTVLETTAEVYCLQYVFKCMKTLGCPRCTKTCNLEKCETRFR